MIIGCCFCVFTVLINKVSLQEPVHREAVIGGSVDLPCFFTQPHLNPQEVNVHWRHNGSEIVYDIINGEDSLDFQDPRYKNRTETFREDYLRGNFSIKLNKVQYTDAGEFGCIITESSPQTVQLIIKESTAEKESKFTVQENQDEETESDSVETSSYWIPIIIIIVLLSIVLSISLSVVYYCKRKKQGSSFSSVNTQMTG